MNDLKITDINSLDAQEIKIDGVDIEQVLTDTKVRGEQIKRRRRWIQGSSILVSVLIVSIVATLTAMAFDSPTQVAQDNDVVVEITIPEVVTTLPATPQTSLAPTTAAIQTPTNVVVRSFGNESVCNATSNPNPGDGMVSLGPSNVLESWNPRIGDTYQVVKSNNETLTIIAKASNDAPRGQFIDLNSGFTTNGSFADITTFGFRYCEPGLRLDVNQSTNGYTVDILRW